MAAAVWWLMGGAYLFCQNTEAPYYFVKLMFYVTVFAALLVLAVVFVMVPINGMTRHWARTTRSWDFHGVQALPWLVVLSLYGAEADAIYWLAERFVVLGE